jgi:hypothetical protein
MYRLLRDSLAKKIGMDSAITLAFLLSTSFYITIVIVIMYIVRFVYEILFF